MSETAHTPGPWLREDAMVYALNKGGTNRMSLYVQGGHTSREDKTYTTREELAANAQLISAAPDMLEALKEARERLATMANMTGSRSDDEWVWRAQELVAAAISKATGEPVEEAS